MKIIHQEESEKQGNDCIIKNCFVILECHNKYIAANFRRYIGWNDYLGLDVRGLHTLDTEKQAWDHLAIIKELDL